MFLGAFRTWLSNYLRPMMAGTKITIARAPRKKNTVSVDTTIFRSQNHHHWTRSITFRGFRRFFFPFSHYFLQVTNQVAGEDDGAMPVRRLDVLAQSSMSVALFDWSVNYPPSFRVRGLTWVAGQSVYPTTLCPDSSTADAGTPCFTEFWFILNWLCFIFICPHVYH